MKASEILQEAKLDDLLAEFRNAMIRKFWARHEYQESIGGASVCDPDFDWTSLSHEAICSHLQEEIKEWEEAEAWRTSGGDSDGEESGVSDEAVDLANMAFLDWVYHQITIALVEQEAE